MKVQLAYRYTGEDREKLTALLEEIRRTLESSGNTVWVPELDPLRPSSIKELFNKTFRKLDECDVLLVILRSTEKSEGMLMEVGYAIARGKKIWLAVQDTVKNTRLRDFADFITEFSSDGDLCMKLKNPNANPELL